MEAESLEQKKVSVEIRGYPGHVKIILSIRFFFTNIFTLPCLNSMFTVCFTNTHLSTSLLSIFCEKCTTSTKTLHTSPKSDSCCHNYSLICLPCHSKYNKLNNLMVFISTTVSETKIFDITTTSLL